MERRILHLDIDAFLASVEQLRDPCLLGRPVAVGTGVVASRSYEAKRRGVSTGMHATSTCVRMMLSTWGKEQGIWYVWMPLSVLQENVTVKSRCSHYTSIARQSTRPWRWPELPPWVVWIFHFRTCRPAWAGADPTHSPIFPTGKNRSLSSHGRKFAAWMYQTT